MLLIVLISIFALIALVFFALFAMKTARHALMFDYNHIIQKRTSTLYFDINGFLLSDNDSTNRDHALGGLRTGDNISSYTQNPDMANYLKTCARIRGNLHYKVDETVDENVSKRTDLIFSPFISNGVLRGVAVTSQTVYSKNREAELLEKTRNLATQNDEAQHLIEKLDVERANLESAFKKSSRHHIQLQKAMYRIEQQNRELEQAIDTINKQNAELERKNEEISRSNKMKEVFLANTSHEIRTPLNAIIGFTNLLLKMSPNEKQLKYLENIKTSGKNLLFIINDILDLSKIEAGKMELSDIDFDLRDMVEKCVNVVNVARDGKNISINIDIDDAIPEIVVGDSFRINQILTNLLNNSIKFTDNNCLIRIKIRLLSANGDDINIGFEVSDNGIGIPKERQSEIFESFTQANADTTRKYGGTGLGLSITRQLVEMYGGKITVESELNQGTTFRFNLNLKKSENKPAKESAKGTTLAPPEKLKILLAEDNEINQQLAVDTLKAWNPDIIIDIAGNGQTAVEKVEATDYDVVLMDIQMPVMDGNAAARTIRNSQSAHKDVPIIAMTAHAFKEERERCLVNGMNDYVMKPFDPEDLIAKICKYARIEFEKKNNGDSDGESIGVPGSFDMRLLVEACADDRAELKKIIGVYMSTVPGDISEMSAASQNGDMEKMRTKRHSLQTTFGYLGMHNAAALLKATYDEGADIPYLSDQIAAVWQQTMPMIKEFVEKM